MLTNRSQGHWLRLAGLRTMFSRLWEARGDFEQRKDAERGSRLADLATGSSLVLRCGHLKVCLLPTSSRALSDPFLFNWREREDNQDKKENQVYVKKKSGSCGCQAFKGKNGEWGAHRPGLAATAPSSGVGSTPPSNSAT